MKSYAKEHIHDDGECEILVNKHDEILLLGKNQSWHISNKV